VEIQALRGAGMRAAEEEELRGVLLAFAAIAKVKKANKEVMLPIVTGCESESEIVRSAALHRLVVLSHYFEAAGTVLETLCLRAPTDIRVLALTYIANAPAKLTTKVVRLSLADEQSQVRVQSARLAAGLRSRRVQQLLKKRLESEGDEKIKVILKNSIQKQSILK
jgi:HEAT repeat protein